MQLFDMLKKDHKEFRDLFTILSKQQVKNDEVLESLCEKLMIHMKLEEQYFYPMLEEFQETSSLAKESYAEHQEAKELIKVIRQENLDSETLNEKIDMLELAVNDHIREEENETFPKAERLFSREEIEDIGRTIASKREEALRR